MDKKDIEEITPFHVRLKKLRVQKGVNIREMADLIGVPKNTYRDWETGKSIRGEPYLQIAEVLGVSLDTLMSGREKIQREKVLHRILEIELQLQLLKKDILLLTE